MIRGQSALSAAREDLAALSALDELVAALLMDGVNAGTVRKTDGHPVTRTDRLPTPRWQPSSLLEPQVRAELPYFTYDGQAYPVQVVAYWPRKFLAATMPDKVESIEFDSTFLAGKPGLLDGDDGDVAALLQARPRAQSVADYLHRINQTVLPAATAIDPVLAEFAGRRVGWASLDRADAMPGLPWTVVTRYDSDDFEIGAAQRLGSGPLIVWTPRQRHLQGLVDGMVAFIVKERTGGVSLDARLPNAPMRPQSYPDLTAAKVAAGRMLADMVTRSRMWALAGSPDRRTR